jgi:glucose/arabinose dehydrogenase
MRRLSLLAVVMLTACTSAASTNSDSTTAATPTTPASTTTTAGTTSSTISPMTTDSSTIPIGETVLRYEEVANPSFPVQMTARPGDEPAYLITKDGRVWLFDGEGVSPEPVLDISAEVRDSGEQGLLSIALHPTDPTRLFLHYSDRSGNTVVSEFEMTDQGTADPGSEKVLFQANQPASNHNGGMLLFMPDGRLLLGLGDGGGAGDRFGNGQSDDTFLGGLVALDPDGGGDPVRYAKGLRNPWRFWIDDGRLYIADVGQNQYEEVSVVGLEPGLNFGWPITEGLHCYRDPSGCDTDGLVEPVIEIEHGDAGTCSITGGIVYRGASMPQLSGQYFYSDYCGGYLRSALLEPGQDIDLHDWTPQVGIPGSVTGFGIDGAGEMYVMTTGALLKVIPAG